MKKYFGIIIILIVIAIRSGTTVKAQTEINFDVIGFRYDLNAIEANISGLTEQEMEDRQFSVISKWGTEITAKSVSFKDGKVQIRLPVPLTPHQSYTLKLKDSQGFDVFSKNFQAVGLSGGVVKRVSVLSYDKTPLRELQHQDPVQIEAVLYNPCQTELTVDVIVGFFADEQLVESKLEGVKIPPEADKQVSIAAEYLEDSNIGVFLLEPGTIKPLSHAYRFEHDSLIDEPQFLPDFFLASDTLDSLYFNQQGNKRISPIWTGVDLFNYFSYTADGSLYPAILNNSGFAWMGSEAWTDYSVSADVRFAKDSETNSLMLATRHSNTLYYGDSFYSAGIWNGDSLAIVKSSLSPTRETDMQVVESMPFNIGQGWSGKLTVVAVDNVISLYVDHEKMLSFTDINAPLSTGNVGIVAVGASGIVSNIKVEKHYDQNGGHIDNFLRSGWQKTSEQLEKILSSTEKSQLVYNHEGFNYYVAPEFSLDLNTMDNQMNCRDFFTSSDEFVRNDKYASFIDGGLTITGGLLKDDFTIETEVYAYQETLFTAYLTDQQQLMRTQINDATLYIEVGDGRHHSFPLKSSANKSDHLIFSYNNGILKIYENGLFVGDVHENIDIQNSSFTFFQSSVGQFGLLRLYDFALSEQEAILRYGAEYENFGSEPYTPIEVLDFSRYVYKTMPIMENSADNGATITLADDVQIRKQYERTALGQNITYLNTINSTRKMGIFIGDEGDYSAYKNRDQLTVAFWVNISSPRNGQFHRLLSMGDKERTNFAFEVALNNSVLVVNGSEFDSDNSVSRRKQVDISDYVNRWCHLVFTRRYVESANTWQFDLYADGQQIMSHVQDAQRSDQSPMRLSVGSQPNGSNSFWGYIGDVRIYADYMEQSDVLSLYRDGILKFKSMRQY